MKSVIKHDLKEMQEAVDAVKELVRILDRELSITKELRQQLLKPGFFDDWENLYRSAREDEAAWKKLSSR